MKRLPDSSKSTGGVSLSSEIHHVEAWSIEEFAGAEAQWQDLLQRSNADPLFMSWNWQWCWWNHHASQVNSKLWLLAGYSMNGELVGLAPLHLHRAAHRKPLSAMRLELIGSTWRDRIGAFSEYLDFVVDVRFEHAFSKALAKAVLRDHRWSDLVISNSKRSSLAANFARDYLSEVCYVREIDPLVAHLARLSQDFGSYLKTLNPEVRRKLWNKRSKLSDPQFTIVRADGIDEVFGQLNNFHQQRWGSRPLEGSRGVFHREFARRCAERGWLRMSTLSASGILISAMYNIRIGATEYNIQSGFDPGAIKGLSPGYLHFGFCIEQACSDGMTAFDFLAGDGRARNYKEDFICQPTELCTLQCIRMAPLAWLYRRYDQRVPAPVVL